MNDKEFLAKNYQGNLPNPKEVPKVVIDAQNPKLTKEEVLLSVLMKAHPNEAFEIYCNSNGTRL